jgi:6-phosphogluconolactonase
MSKRLGWLLGVVVLVSIGVLVACGSNYNPSSDGLLLVGSQGSGLIETFSFTLNNGHATAISNTPNDTSSELCVLNGIPSSIVVDPAGAYAYTIINANVSCQGSTTGILAFKVNSDGTTTQVGNQVPFLPSPAAAVVPGMMVMDASGKFLFVADRATTTNPDGSGLPVSGSVSVFAIGSGGSLKEVAGSPFFPTPLTIVQQSSLDIVSVASTPTVFPAIGLNGVQSAVCSDVGNNPPTLEYLYAVDRLGYQVFEFAVNTTTGVLTNPSLPSSEPSSEPSFPTDPSPAGVAVDPCNRFVYVSDSLTDKVSAYTICNGSVTSQVNACKSPTPPGALVPVAGSPFSLVGSTYPGPLLVDAYGNFLYVLGTGSNTIDLLKISPVSGALAPLNPATVATGVGPVSMTIRSDDSWLFVANYGATTVGGANPSPGGTTVSEFGITPESGALAAQPLIQTDNYPWGLAVK